MSALLSAEERARIARAVSEDYRVGRKHLAVEEIIPRLLADIAERERIMDVLEADESNLRGWVAKRGKRIAELEGEGDIQRAEVAELRKDKDRLDWLESESVSDRVGNGLAIFPTTTAASGELGFLLVDLCDEDVGEDIGHKEPTLRAAIDAAREAKV